MSGRLSVIGCRSDLSLLSFFFFRGKSTGPSRVSCVVLEENLGTGKESCTMALPPVLSWVNTSLFC